MSVLIIGGSVAGLAVADGLRDHGYADSITIVDMDPSLPYDKPPLSKQALTPEWNPVRGLLRPEHHYRDNEITLCLGHRAVSLDIASRTVQLDDASELRGDHIVITTGLKPRRFSAEDMLPGVHVIRSSSDSAAVREALNGRPRVVVIGGGFIGAEAAATIARQGLDVTVVERLPQPFQHLFGPEIADVMAGWHRAAGIRLECGVAVTAVEGRDRVEQIHLSNGRVLDADLVLVGIGATPEVSWLESSGIALDDGVVCDEFGRTNLPEVWAAGDAAMWSDPKTGRHTRVEHWTTAREQGAAIAHNIANPGVPPKGQGIVPYFWSDQHGHRVQSLGKSIGHDSVHIVHGSLDETEFVALFAKQGRLIGALGVSATRYLMRYREPIAQSENLDKVLSAVEGNAISGQPA